MKIILASQSPFRKHALDILGLKCEIIPSYVDESVIRHEEPDQLAIILAEAKCRKVAEIHKNAIIISADLFIVFNNNIFEKPKSKSEAKSMLNNFSGHPFKIISGLAVFNSKTEKLLLASESCVVNFRVLSNFEIDDYISRYPVEKFAGAFDADGLLRFAERIEGNYNFKAGLPVNRLIEFLRENNLKV
ncbi:MAG: Maf family nucleotide pyrophosphatase [bacterium]|nr:Maf family nucleotide pyrophosphatase [bacterium]